jgi:GNAT superfamily N-acetyltransferase
VNPAKYAAVERLRDGTLLQIRAVQPSDRAWMLAALARASSTSLYRRFFAPKRAFSDREIDFLVNVDFVGHVALAAVMERDGREVVAGGGRYVVSGPATAEVAFAVEDPHQGLGIATRVLRHLIGIGRDAGLDEFVAEVLSENAPMLSVFQRSGLPMKTRREGGVVHVTLDLSPSPGRT